MSIKVDVGRPPTQWTNKFEDWTTINVCFHRFNNLTTMRDESFFSPGFSCCSHQWKLKLYPGGRANSGEGYVTLSLINMTDANIKIQYGYSVRDASSKEVVHHTPKTDEFPSINSENNGKCTRNFAERSTLMEALVDGTLIIEVRMKSVSTDKSITQFIPSNPIIKNVLQKFDDEETADIVFEVADDNGSLESEEHTNKKSKTTETFHAHRLILQMCTPTLYEMCGVSDEGITTVSITDIKPNIFGRMIYYTYGGKLTETELKTNAKDIIDACDKYGVVNLKLEAEAAYVESTEITIENMMDNLLYADSKNLALLKEAVMDFILENKHSIIGKLSFDNFPTHLVTDLLTAVARGEQPLVGEEDQSIKYNRMRVGELRKMLDEKGLDVDGSREAMIALLKDHNSAEASV